MNQQNQNNQNNGQSPQNNNQGGIPQPQNFQNNQQGLQNQQGAQNQQQNNNQGFAPPVQPQQNFQPNPGMPQQPNMAPMQAPPGAFPPGQMPQNNFGQQPQQFNPQNQNLMMNHQSQQNMAAQGVQSQNFGQPPKPLQPQDPNARSGQLKARQDHVFVIPPHPNTTFDEKNFLNLLEGSISLTLEEKKRVCDAIPRLRIEQINELISIFEEEKQKFAELENEFSDDVAKLKREREREIESTQIKKEEEDESSEDTAEAEALKKKLMG